MKNIIDNEWREAVYQYCDLLGKDSLLVQGAGGNISWKDQETLWIKASGTWLADACIQDIFVPVQLPPILQAIYVGNFNVIPTCPEGCRLKPSIETLLHALMPHKVVAHLHAIDILAHLVRENYLEDIKFALSDSTLRWTSVVYRQPGAILAEAVYFALLAEPKSEVIFLQNHGVIIGGADIAEVDLILRELLQRFKIVPIVQFPMFPVDQERIILDDQIEYALVGDQAIQALATCVALYDRLATDWALYPDHIVFLGEKAHFYDSIDSFRSKMLFHEGSPPELIFVREVGVFATQQFNSGKQAQLRCYYDILLRQAPENVLNALSESDVLALLHWDAERYRLTVAK